MIKKILCLTTLVLLTGCEPNSLQKAQQDFVCYNRGGVYDYSSMFGNVAITEVKCFNGEWVQWSPNMIIPKEFYPKKKEMNNE